MSFGSRIAVVTIWFALIGAAGGAWSYAQTPAPAQPSTIISGADLGFRVDRMDGQTPVGAFVVRKDGQLVEVRESVGPRRVTSR